VVSLASADGDAEVTGLDMWICQKCGEAHQDQFRECWKCVGAEIDSQEKAAPPTDVPPAAERELRSRASILIRIAIAFVVGLIFGMAVFHRHGASLAQAATLGTIVAVTLAIVVGVLLWVVFPFKAAREGDRPKRHDALILIFGLEFLELAYR
jgi:uncharacterized membrane protein YvbJ